jgi:predicted ATPase
MIKRVRVQSNPAAAQRWLTEAGDNLSAWLVHLQTRHGDAFGRIAQVCRDVFPEFEDKVTLEELIVFEKSQGATVLKFPKDRDQLRELLECEEVGLGDLHFSGSPASA